MSVRAFVDGTKPHLVEVTRLAVLAAGSSWGAVAGAGFAVLGVLWVYAMVAHRITAHAQRIPARRRWLVGPLAMIFAADTHRVDRSSVYCRS